jgi:hypothetical protein
LPTDFGGDGQAIGNDNQPPGGFHEASPQD